MFRQMLDENLAPDIARTAGLPSFNDRDRPSFVERGCAG
jgi:hypothetical protein